MSHCSAARMEQPRDAPDVGEIESIFEFKEENLIFFSPLKRTAKYCSVECQKGHWSEHKKTCQGMLT